MIAGIEMIDTYSAYMQYSRLVASIYFVSLYVLAIFKVVYSYMPFPVPKEYNWTILSLNNVNTISTIFTLEVTDCLRFGKFFIFKIALYIDNTHLLIVIDFTGENKPVFEDFNITNSFTLRRLELSGLISV